MAEPTLSAEARAEIMAACERLSHDYAHLADAGRMEEWSHLFAEDGELMLPGAVVNGRPAILKAVSGPRGDIVSIHSMTNIRIDVESPTKASGLVYITAFQVPKKDGVGPMVAIAPSVVGQYADEYVKTADGWRFARRAFTPLVTAAS
ncbi:MAG TPA: nuclear transport factor 2 family protein [Caulobacteraceae bacterium]|nr:nuclear transport factor 2 family protein [Caulobacteraceae bacterium]